MRMPLSTTFGVSVRLSAIHPPASGQGYLVLEAVIANRSDTVLSDAGEGGHRISLSTRWRRIDGPAAAEQMIDGQRFDLAEPVLPGRTLSQVMPLEIAVGPGVWQVTVDLVEESVAWFGDGDEFVIELEPREIAARDPARPELFQALLVETRNTCNRACWFCKFGQERTDAEVVQMDWAMIRRIIANLKTLDYRGRVSWHGINEPLLDPRLVDIVGETREACPGAFISVVTNGDALTPERYERLKGAGMDVLGVSLYDDKVFGRVRQFADAQMKLIDMRNATPGWLENRGGTVEQCAGQFGEHQERFVDRICERPTFMMSIKASGQVALCCADMYGDVVMGDARTQRLEEVWYGERFTHYRRTLAAEGRRALPLCQTCSYKGDAGRIFYPLPETVTHPKVRVASVRRMVVA